MIAAIIQARNGSTRLPGKTCMKIAGKTVLEHVFSRVKKAETPNEVFVATTVNPEDLPLVRLCAEKGIRVFCGSADDVLDRFYQLAKLIKPDHVIRITADCPLMDPAVIDKTVKTHLKAKADYTSNVAHPTFPDGLDVEIFTFKALERTWQCANLASEREHVTTYIRNHPELFTQAEYKNPEDLSKHRWTLDEHQDWDFISAVYKELYDENPVFGIAETLKLLAEKPELERLNSDITRNEGLLKSLRNDKQVFHGP
ncbi:MAG: glycosyltransferase family protein [Elusimicrobiaceae bacterium]